MVFKEVGDRLSDLDAAIRVVCPIHGISAGDPPRIDYRDEATAEQRAAALEVVRTFDRRPRRKRPLVQVAQLLRDWAQTSALPTEREQRWRLIALLGGAPGMLAHPELAKALGIPEMHDEVVH